MIDRSIYTNIFAEEGKELGICVKFCSSVFFEQLTTKFHDSVIFVVVSIEGRKMGTVKLAKK